MISTVCVPLVISTMYDRNNLTTLRLQCVHLTEAHLFEHV